MSRTYEPAEGRRGVYATLALMAGLVVLSLVALSALPGPSGGMLGEPAGRDAGGGEGPAGEPSEVASEDPAPESLSFFCSDNTVRYWDSVRLAVEEKDRAQAAVERFILAAYGDPGADAWAYEARVEPLVLGCFWESFAGGYAEEVEEFARAGGREGAGRSSVTAPSVGYALDLVLFEVTSAQQKVYEGGVGYLTMQGNAVWVVEEQDGELGGREQRLELVRKAGDDEGWKVMSGAPMPPGYSTETRHEVKERIEELQYGG